jgi:hypothetical protein
MNCTCIRKIEWMRDHAKSEQERTRGEGDWVTAQQWEREFYVLSAVLAELRR